MKTKKTYLFVASLAASLLVFACGDNNETPTVADAGKFVPNFVLAKTGAELEAIRADERANVIRTLEDFDKVIELKRTPLAYLPGDVIKDFRDNLIVRENLGIVGIKFRIIKAQLSQDEFAEVMALFGLDAKQGFWGFSKDPSVLAKMKIRGGRTMTDYEKYKCVSRATCESSSAHICLTGC
jgi:hypothetical protein